MRWRLRMPDREFAASSHPGLRRERNEDSYEADAARGLWLVADGVGGHACGDVASGIVRDTMQFHIARGAPLVTAVKRAHAAILQASAERPETLGMGSTVAAALIDGNNFEIAWVGDSRIYRWRQRLEQLSSDHNRVGELLRMKLIEPAEAGTHPERHVLTQSLGVSVGMHLDPGYGTGVLEPGDRLLLCSDGLTDELSDSLIAHVLGSHDTPRSQADALISAALEAGGRDNITVIVIGDLATAAPATAAGSKTSGRSDRCATGGRPNDGHFPFKTVLMLSTLALLAVWLLS